MTGIRAVFNFHETTTLSFDCYGTLVDWENGACRALRQTYGYSHFEITDDALIDLFLQAEARFVSEKVFPYWQVLQCVAQSVAVSLGVRSDRTLQSSFASSLPGWPLFHETNPALTWLARRYRLAIISNVDNRLISETMKKFHVPFDVVMTSEQASSYKPDRAIFDQAVVSMGETPSSIIHIAEGRCEARTAKALGMRSIWVNRSLRSDDGSNAKPDAVASTLTQIVEAIA